MAGFKDFTDGVELFGDELDGYLMRQTVMRFPTTVALFNQLPPGIRELGMLAWADSTGVLYMFDGTNWIPWQSPEKTFSPSFTAGGTPITFSNSVQTSMWRYSGGLVQWNYRLVIGSSANFGAGAYAMSLPIATRTELNQHYMGPMSYYDTSAATMFHRACVTLGTTTSIGIVAEAGQRMGSAAPVAWGAGDEFGFSLRYPPSTGTYI